MSNSVLFCNILSFKKKKKEANSQIHFGNIKSTFILYIYTLNWTGHVLPTVLMQGKSMGCLIHKRCSFHIRIFYKPPHQLPVKTTVSAELLEEKKKIIWWKLWCVLKLMLCFTRFPISYLEKCKGTSLDVELPTCALRRVNYTLQFGC